MEKSVDKILSCFLQHTTWPGAAVIGKIKLQCLQHMLTRRCIIAGGWGQHIYQVSKGQPGLYDFADPCAVSDVDCFNVDPVGDFKSLIKRFLKQYPRIDFRVTTGMGAGVFTLSMLGGSVHLSDAVMMPSDLFDAYPTLLLNLQIGSLTHKVRISHPLIEIARRNKMFAEIFNFGASNPVIRLERLGVYQKAILTDIQKIRSVTIPLPAGLKVSKKSQKLLKHLWGHWLPSQRSRAPLVGLSALEDVCDKVSLEVLVDSAYFQEVCRTIVKTCFAFTHLSKPTSKLSGVAYEPLSGVCPTYLGTFEIFNDDDVIARLHCGITATTCHATSNKNVYISSYGHIMSYLALDWVAARKVKATHVEAYFMYRLATNFDPESSAKDIAGVSVDKVCGKLPTRNVYLDYVKNRSKARLYSYWSDRNKDEPNGPVQYRKSCGRVLQSFDFVKASDSQFDVPFV